MLYVPVVGSADKPLMPCHPARARELVRKGKALRRFNRGIFYIKLTERETGETQEIGVGIDPGSKKEAITVKSASHTYLNIQADAVTWVKDAVETRRIMRRARRQRKTPYRTNRMNRKRGGIPPSTRARWGWKLRLCRWLSKLYPITQFVVEDIKAVTKGKRRWDASFSPLQVGKQWFYSELEKMAPVALKRGQETKNLRDIAGLNKTRNKMSDTFDAHCVDSWVLANSYTGGHVAPENTRMLKIIPLRFHRRQLHRLQPSKGGKRKRYGGTMSLGLKRGSLVKHLKWGLTYVGGYTKDRLNLHSPLTRKRICRSAKVGDCTYFATNTWRTLLLAPAQPVVSAT